MDEGKYNGPVPVLLVTGFLGAGKTSLINSVLQADHGLRLAAVVNDFGSVNIDEAILSPSGQAIYGLENGCICCTLQGDLLRTLRGILFLGHSINGIVIEASGVSDPAGILEALFDPVLSEAVRLDAVVTVVDAQEHDATDELWRAQVRAADFVVLSKAQSVEPHNLARLSEVLTALHKDVVFVADADGGVPIDLIFGTGSERAEWLGSDTPHLPVDARFTRLAWSCLRPVSLGRFQNAIQSLASQLVRAKGFLAFREEPERPYLFQMVGQRASLSRTSQPVVGAQLVLIGKTGVLDAGHAKSVLESMR
jgi:G3E family GTPase